MWVEQSRIHVSVTTERGGPTGADVKVPVNSQITIAAMTHSEVMTDDGSSLVSLEMAIPSIFEVLLNRERTEFAATVVNDKVVGVFKFAKHMEGGSVVHQVLRSPGYGDIHLSTIAKVIDISVAGCHG
jgi:DNA polymerase II small subunit/DNA polymerase delta subunit B